MSTESPYRRDNYFGESDGTDTPDEPAGGHRVDREPASRRYARHIAHRYLRDHAPTYCGATLNDPPYAPSISADLEAHDVSELAGVLWDGPGIAGDRDSLAMHHSNRAIELSDAEYYPPRNDFAGGGTSRYHACRVNPETGYLNYRETTWVQLGSVPWEQLREALVIYTTEQDIAEKKTEYLLNTAKRSKHNPNDTASDLDIFTRSVAAMHEKYGSC